MLCCLAALPATACRCAEQTLAEYFSAADEVFIGTLQAIVELDSQRREFRFATRGQAYKSQEDVRPYPYVSTTSSAACAVTATVGADYVVFAEADESSGASWITSCNGTRLIDTENSASGVFKDVPGRFVVSQLTALAGLEALARIARAEGSASHPDNETLQGLLDIAALSHTEHVPLFAAANGDSCAIARLSSYEQLEHREVGYEQVAAEVYAYADDADQRWYKVRLTSGAYAWLSPDAAGTYWPVDELLPRRLNYLTNGWNRMLWPSLGAGLPTRLAYSTDTPPREQPVNVISTARIGGSLWLEVEVLRSSPCESGDSRALARGWIPAYSGQGELVAWYYSRGC